MIATKDLKEIALDSNADYAAVIETSTIQFHEDVRRACERNVCGKYDTSWMGPPAIGPINALKKRVRRYRQGLLFQTVHETGGSFDMKGMFEAAKLHDTLFRNFLQKIKDSYPDEDILALDAGCCSYCEKCAYLDKEPCRSPDQALSSVEAYGMNVAALMKIADMPYNHGKGALGFVGLILFNPGLTFKRSTFNVQHRTWNGADRTQPGSVARSRFKVRRSRFNVQSFAKALKRRRKVRHYRMSQ